MVDEWNHALETTCDGENGYINPSNNSNLALLVTHSSFSTSKTKTIPGMCGGLFFSKWRVCPHDCCGPGTVSFVTLLRCHSQKKRRKDMFSAALILLFKITFPDPHVSGAVSSQNEFAKCQMTTRCALCLCENANS